MTEPLALCGLSPSGEPFLLIIPPDVTSEYRIVLDRERVEQLDHDALFELFYGIVVFLGQQALIHHDARVSCAMA